MTEDAKVRVGQLLLERRIERGDSAAAVGRLLGGASQALVSKWEAGDGRPTLKRAAHIADYLDLPLAEVLDLMYREAVGAPADPSTAARQVELEQLVHALQQQVDLLTKQVDALAENVEPVGEVSVGQPRLG